MHLNIPHDLAPGANDSVLRTRWCLLVLLLLGLILRIWVVFHVPLEPVFDFRRYFEAATSLALEGRLSNSGHPYIIQGPAYPFVLGLFFKIFGIGIWQGKTLNILLSFAAIVLMDRIAVSMNSPNWVRLSMVGVMALHPGLVLYVNVLGTECLSIFLVTVGALAAMGRSLWSLVVLGVSLAALCLNRPQYLPAVILLVCFLGGGRAAIVRRAVFCLLPFCLVMAPWVIRNAHVFGEFIPVSASAGYVSLVNNNDNATGRWMPLSQVPLSEHDKLLFLRDGTETFFAPGDEGAKVVRWPPYNDRIALSLALRWIKTHPREFASLAGKRLAVAFYSPSGDMLFWPLRDVGGQPLLSWTVIALDLFLFAVAAFGMCAMVWRQSRYWRMGLFPALIVLGGVGAICVFEGQGRYVLPMVPATLMLAVLFLTERKVVPARAR
jgi:hypothetical protein